MKSIIRKLSYCALLGVSSSAYAAPVLIPNGDFSTPGGADFGFFESAAGVVSFPATGGAGDDGGYGLVNNTLGSWGGGLVSPPDNAYPSNQGIPLATLGLVAGNTYTFSMDMKNFAGTGKGGLKVESWNGGGGAFDNTGDMPASGSSNQWANYTWNYSIPAGATSIKIVPLVTGASGASTADSVGFDNIKVNNTPVTLPPIIPFVPNGDFETPGGANWSYFTDGFGLSYPTTGGNPGGNAVIDGTLPGGYGVLVAFNNTEKTLASLGLTAGGTYTFQMDMKIIDGPNIGGLKLEGPAGYVYESRPAKIGDGTQWATYSFEVTFPPTLNQFKIVPLWGISSKVAYDNVKILLPAPPAPLQATITTGKTVSWTAASAVNRYQLQESADNTTWTNVGAPVIGNAFSSVFDESVSPFYQVLESVPAVQQAIYNGDFAIAFFDDADGWTPVQSQPPVLQATGGRTDNGACMKISVLNVGATPNGSEIQQNTDNVVENLNGEIIPGSTYNFSFWAKQISSGVSYEQRYKVSFLNGSGGIVGDGGFVFFSPPVGGAWTQFTQNNLVAPAGATTALIQILGVTGAVDGGSGEVLIDDVSLLSSGFGAPNVPPLATTTTPAVEISWPSDSGQDYQVQSSVDLGTWTNFGPVISGDGSVKAVYDTMIDKKFYKVGELP
jgi:hypothetical protein